VNLTNNDMDNHAPEWIPNGALIVFYAAPYKGNWDIYRINHNGKNLINLTQGHQTTQESFPDWQP
jgi:Tol biopolymer transport system component